MLYYKPPFLFVDSLTIFCDHQDPEAFYYLVSLPELASAEDGPSFWGLVVLPDVSVTIGGGAVAIGRVSLSFDVQLAASEALLTKARAEIQRYFGREAKRLDPVPLHSGKADLTVARPGGNEPTKDLFVYQGNAPTLLGDNRAAFALAARDEEAQALVAALSVGQVPAVVAYELEFYGLTPSFRARMTVHWSAAYHYLRNHSNMNFIFYADEVDKVIDTFAERRIVEVQVEELDPEGASAATKALFDELKTQLVQKLMSPARSLGEVPIEDRIVRGIHDSTTSILPGVFYSLRTIDESALSDTTIDIREQQAKSYHAYPQSTLAGLLQRAGGVGDRLKYVKLVDLPNRVEELRIELAAGSEALGVKAVVLEVQALTPGRDEPLLDKTVLLLPQQTTPQLLHYRREGSAEPRVRFKATMQLDPAVAPDGHERWELDWRDVSGDRIWFNPEAWLDAVSLQVEIDDPALFDLPATAALAVEAWLDGDAEPVRRGSLNFTKSVRSQSFSVIVPQGRVPHFRGREIFRRQGEPDFVRELPAIPGPVHRIMNPFGQTFTMELHAISTWRETAQLTAELRVWDPTRKTWSRDQHTFTGQAPTWTLRVNTSPETPRKAEVRLTRVTTDQQVVRGPWQDLVGPVVSISDDVKPLRRVRATLAAPRYKDLGVKKVRVSVIYDDPAHGVHDESELVLLADGATADWLHPFPDPTHPEYSYRVHAIGENGERWDGPLSRGSEDDLAISLPDDAW